MQTSGYQVIGIIGTHAGNEKVLTYHRPFIRVNTNIYAAMRDEWSPDDLQIISPAEHDYINPTREMDVNCGDVVFACGPVMWQRLTCADLLPAGEWRLNNRFRLSTGSVQDFKNLLEPIYQEVLNRLMVSDYGNKDAFAIYENIHLERKYEEKMQHLIRYYRKHGQEDKALLIELEVLNNG